MCWDVDAFMAPLYHIHIAAVLQRWGEFLAGKFFSATILFVVISALYDIWIICRRIEKSSYKYQCAAKAQESGILRRVSSPLEGINFVGNLQNLYS
jgi:hypothetical protein